jgi:hypothetical protein
MCNHSPHPSDIKHSHAFPFTDVVYSLHDLLEILWMTSPWFTTVFRCLDYLWLHLISENRREVSLSLSVFALLIGTVKILNSLF